MATYYWSGTGTWDNSSTTNWYNGTGGTGGNAPNAPLPTDIVIFNAASGAGTCTIAATAVCTVVTLTGFTGTLAFGTSGKITITASTASTAVTGDTTFTVTGTNPLIEINVTTTGTVFVTMGAMTEANSISVTVLGIGSKNVSGSFRNLRLAGTLANVARTVYGNLTFDPGSSWSGNNVATTMAATSGTQTVTTNGTLMQMNFIVNAPGATVELADDFNTSTVRAFSVLAGTFNTNNYALTIGTFTSTGSLTRTINLGSSIVNVLGSGTAWNCLSATNLTLNAGTSTIFFSNVSTKTMYGGTGLTYWNIKNAGGAATLTIAGSAGSGSCSFNEWQADSLPCTYAVTPSYTQTLTNFPPSGTSSAAMFCITSATDGSQFTLSKASGTWNATHVYVRDCIFTGGATWNATNSVDGGNNSGTSILYTGVARYWVGGSGTWDTTSTANWSSTDGGASGASAPGPGDYAYFPSGTTGTVTLGADVTVSKWEVFGTPTFTFAFNGYKVITDWLGECFKTATGMTVTGTPRVDMTYAGGWSVGPSSARHGSSNGTILEANTISLYVTAGTALTGTPARFKTLDFTGFTGALQDQFTRACFGNWVMHSGMTPGGGTGALTFGATSGVQEIYCGGAAFNCPVTFNGVGGTFRFMDAFTNATTRVVSLTNGTLDANGFNVTLGTFSFTNSNVRTLTMGAGTWTVTGNGTNAWAGQTSTNLTVNCDTSTVLMTSASAKTFSGGDKTWYNLAQGGAGVLTITGSNTFNDLTAPYLPSTITITAGTTQTFTNFSAAGILNDPLTINSTAGTYTFVKVSGTVSSSYLNITNCIGSPAATWSATYSTQTTCTDWSTTNLATTYYWVGGSGTWNNSTTTNWSLSSGGAGGAGYPLLDDIVIFNSSSGGGTCTIGANVNCKTLTLTGYTGELAFGSNKISVGGASTTVYTGDITYTVDGTPRLDFVYPGRNGTRVLSSSGSTDPAEVMDIYITAGTDTVQFTQGHRWGTINFTGSSVAVSNTTKTIYGSLILSPTLASMGGNQNQTLAGTGSHVIDCAGSTVLSHPITLSGSGTYTLQSDYYNVSYGLTHSAGTFDANNYNVTSLAFSSNNSSVRTLTMGSGTWTLTGSGASVWTTATTTNLTFNRGTGTIVLNNSAAKTFTGGGLTFYNISQGGAGALTIVNSNGFNDIQNAYGATGATSILFTAGTTQTVANFSAGGSAGNLLTISSPTAATHTLVKTGGQVSADYLDVSYSIVDASPAWYAGANSTNSGNNTNWNFTVPPGSSSNSNFFLVF